MNPLFQKFAGGIARTLLASALVPVVHWLTVHGYVNGTDAQQFDTWLTGVIIVSGWSLYQKHTEQLKLLVAASAHAVVTEQQVENTIKSGVPLPPATTPKDEVPKPSTPATFGR